MAIRSLRARRWRVLLGLVAVAGVGIGVALLRVKAKAPDHEPPSWIESWDRYDEAIPDDVVLREDLERAIDLRRREHFDRVLDARDPGELLEHATLIEPVFEKRGVTIDTLFIVGDEFFNYAFRPENGWGRGGDNRSAIDYTPRPHRVHLGADGGPDAFACSSCHFKGGPDGAGTQSQNGFLRGDGAQILTADQRNPPHLLGLGPVAALAAEMSKDLQAQAAATVARARGEGRRIDAELATKGVSFGRIAAEPAGTLDTSAVAGIDPDLTVRPFGWKGHQATLRGMIEESLHIHQGLLSSRIQHAVHDGRLDGAPYGRGATWYDLDDDGVSSEVDSGMLSTMVGYLAQLETPLMRPPRDPALLDAFAVGRASFDTLGCAGCHVPALELQDTALDVRAEPGRTPLGPPVVIDVAKDGDEPKIEPRYAGAATSYLVPLFSDLKRHDMGDALASREPQGAISVRHFLTRSLWGLAETAPYLHDGRAPTVHEAIVLHGGEAAGARDAYLALAPEGRAAVRVFLVSLSRQPKIFVP
jgi:hypothetical protein